MDPARAFPSVAARPAAGRARGWPARPAPRLLARRRTWQLRLAGLEFVDVAGATEPVRLSRDRRVVLHDPPPPLRRILALRFPDAVLDLRP